MSENSLEIRNKFINKINNKIKDLNDNITLLSKVDNKIFKNTNSQYGGNNQFQMIKNINRQSGGATPAEVNKSLIELYTKATQKVNLGDVAEQLTKIKKDVEKLHNTIGFLNTTFKEEDTSVIDGILKELSAMDTTNLLDEIDFKVIDYLKQEYNKDKDKYLSIYSKSHSENIDLLIINSNLKPKPKLPTRLTEEQYKLILANEDKRLAAKPNVDIPALPSAPPPPPPPPPQAPGGSKYMRNYF
jgi:hypothetical protein